MRKQIRMRECEGKTIESTSINYDELIVTFTDGTFMMFKADPQDEDEAIIEESDFNEKSWSRFELIDLDIMSADEYDTMKRMQYEEIQKKQDDEDRKKYELLKEKFENKG